MTSDHVVVTPDVAGQYPAPFYEPFTTLAWLAGIRRRIGLGRTVLIGPCRHPLLIARMAANFTDPGGGGWVPGEGRGVAGEGVGALGGRCRERGKLTDDYLRAVRAAWADETDYRAGQIPIWVGGNSDAGLRRAVRLGEAWHPLRFTMPWLREAVDRMVALAAEQRARVPGLAARIALRLTEAPIAGTGRLAGEGTIGQVLDDLTQLRLLGAGTVVLDPFGGDPAETRRPETAWQALATLSARTRHPGEE